MAEAPAPTPTKCDFVFAVMAADKSGLVATVYVARSKHYGTPLVLVDFEVGHIRHGLFQDVIKRLFELIAECGARGGSPGLFATKDLLPLAIRSGLNSNAVHAIPPHMEDVTQQKLAAASHISAGSVKVTGVVETKGRSSPIGGALDFSGGADLIDDPLRAASVYAIVLGLNSQ